MQRRPRSVIAVLAAVLTVAAGCTVPTFAPNGSSEAGPVTSSGAPATNGTADWQPCPDVPKDLVGQTAPGMTYDCAKVSVPRDWNDQNNGETYSIAMIRIRSSKQSGRIGSLLLNPGGPGGSGVELAAILSFGEAFGGLPTEITNRFDIIGFDPRGVGRSDPVKCISPADQDASFGAPPDPRSLAEFDKLVTLNKRIASECGAKYGDQLPFFSTEQAARDMDSLRQAVGDEKLSYLGYSYGTLLGATYAQLFPKNIRAMVLDGAVDPKQNFVEGSETQAKGFERAFTNFTNWCKATPDKCPIAAGARKAVTEALATATTKPVAGADGRKATSGWVFYAVISSLYTESGWAKLADAIAELKQGNAKGVFTLADQYAERKPDGTYSNLFDANMAVNCADTDDAPTIDEVRRLQGEWRQKYPMFGAALATGMLSCAVWPGKRDPYPAGAATGAPPIVVVGTTGDPATPYENTADLASMLGVGQVLTWEGEGHTAYPSTPCIVKAVDGYLIDLKVPQEGLRCPAK
ncbi:alpha/beta hydrolase [Paractinoplanes hotanensis]|uniref:Alpha/beta hydrolase n=1 Tax=Paractinoplanes hotanensis TaxID=2906497 RepID=A0ABT0YBS5_9ACTN|nr:alpha/beta hydrolase [Actinoplanes hotanensis]MCM4083250.1 alpha/beta hydrolase [Actinoplanes hotanensis]